MPPEVTDELNIGVFEDESGRRVPVTRIQSFQGAEHCSWTTYDNVEAIPEGATDTGLRREGRQLWIAPDLEAAYLVSLDNAQDVERWPAAKRPIRCA